MTELQIWLNQTFGGELVFTGLVSMLPVLELRGGIPFGVGIGLPLPLAVLASIVGNMLPIPFLILFTRRVFAWLRRHIPALGGFISRLEKKAESKKKLVLKYEFWWLRLSFPASYWACCPCDAASAPTKALFYE